MLDTFVVASFLLFERSQARTNHRPMRRWLIITSSVFIVIGIALIVLWFVPLD